jgi:hypothetical protein
MLENNIGIVATYSISEFQCTLTGPYPPPQFLIVPSSAAPELEFLKRLCELGTEEE